MTGLVVVLYPILVVDLLLSVHLSYSAFNVTGVDMSQDSMLARSSIGNEPCFSHSSPGGEGPQGYSPGGGPSRPIRSGVSKEERGFVRVTGKFLYGV